MWRSARSGHGCSIAFDSDHKWLVTMILSFFFLFRYQSHPFFNKLSGIGQEESAIGAFWVTDGIDRCLVGFLPRHCLAHKGDFDANISQKQIL